MTNEYSADQEIMRSIAAGDERAFRQLADAQLGAIVTYVTRLLRSPAEAEDIAQETFLRAWQKADSYQPRASVSTWLHTIAHNLAVDRLRRRREHERSALDAERDAAPDSERPQELLEQKSQAERVQLALDALPERQKQALLLCHEQGLNNPETARVMGVNVEAVESLLARGRRRLRELLRTTPGTEPS